MSEYRVSYIVPYRQSTPDRERNLILALNWLGSNFPHDEIVLVELDKVSKLDKGPLPSNLKHVFHAWGGIFNRSLARNIGALNAAHEVLVFTDSDLVMDPRHIYFCTRQCRDTFQAVNPCSAAIDLTEEDLGNPALDRESCKELFSYFESRKIKASTDYRPDMNFAAGSLIIRKKPFFYVGGWPEEFIGWGGEDDVFSYKVDRFLTRTSHFAHIYHLPHERSVYDWYNHPEYKNNCDRMNLVLQMADNELVEYCEKSKQRLLSSPLNSLSKEESEALLAYKLPAPRQLEALEQAKRDGGSLAAYPLILD